MDIQALELDLSSLESSRTRICLVGCIGRLKFAFSGLVGRGKFAQN